MSEPEDIFDEPLDDGSHNGHRTDDVNDAFKVGLRRAGLHWMRAGYEILAGVGALLEELNQRPPGDRASHEPAERIELE
jgi:hypothetical protein